MTTLTIKTNNQYRLLLDASDLTTKQLTAFDYLDDVNAASFFAYKGNIYDLGEAMRTEIDGWDGIYNESTFSGVLVKLDAGDSDRVLIASYYA